VAGRVIINHHTNNIKKLFNIRFHAHFPEFFKNLEIFRMKENIVLALMRETLIFQKNINIRSSNKYGHFLIFL